MDGLVAILKSVILLLLATTLYVLPYLVGWGRKCNSDSLFAVLLLKRALAYLESRPPKATPLPPRVD